MSFARRRIAVPAGLTILVLLMASQATRAFKYIPSALYVLLQEADLIVIATAEVPEAKAERQGKPETAVLKIQKVLKGDTSLKQADLSFYRNMRTEGQITPVHGARAVWLLKKGEDGGFWTPRPDGLRNAGEEEIKRLERMLEIQRRVAGGKTPAEEEIRKLVADADGEFAVFGVHLMARFEPGRFADFAAEAYAKQAWYRGELANLLVAMPQDKALPIVLPGIGKDRGDYVVQPGLNMPLAVLARMVKAQPPRDDAAQRIREALLARYAADGAVVRQGNHYSQGDPLIEILAAVADESCVKVLETALVMGESRDREGTVDPHAVQGLWKVKGAAVLPLFRQRLMQSEGCIQMLLGQNGDAADFTRLLLSAEKRPGRCGFGALDGMKKLIVRAGLPVEDWMEVREYGMGGLKNLDRWKTWWEAHRATFRLPGQEAAPNVRAESVMLEELLIACQASDAATRAKAYQNLGELGGLLLRQVQDPKAAERILVALRAGLEDPDENVRLDAMTAIGSFPGIAGPLAVPLAKTITSNPVTFGFRGSMATSKAFDALKKLGLEAEPAIPEIRKVLNAGYTKTPYYNDAATVLAAAGPKGLIVLLGHLEKAKDNDAYLLGEHLKKSGGALSKDPLAVARLQALAARPKGRTAYAQQAAEAMLKTMGISLNSAVQQEPKTHEDF